MHALEALRLDTVLLKEWHRSVVRDVATASGLAMPRSHPTLLLYRLWQLPPAKSALALPLADGKEADDGRALACDHGKVEE